MDTLSSLKDAIAQRESGGKYDALGKPTAKGSRAYGKYQVMDFNVPTWTKEALGQSLTPEQFLANPQAQEKVAEHKLGQYLQQYGTPEDAASVWFSGRPRAQAGNASDVNGTTTPQYVSDVSNLMHPPSQPYASKQFDGGGTLAQKIKAKYPQYADMNDAELEQKILAKYPQYRDMASGSNSYPAPGQTQAGGSNPYTAPTAPSDTSNSSPTPPEEPKSLLQKAGDVIGGVGDFLFPAVGDVSNLIQGKSTKSAGQIAGDVGLSVLPFIPGLGMAGEVARGTKLAAEAVGAAEKAGLASKVIASPITRNALAGYGIGASQNLAEGKDLGSSLSPNLNTVGGTLTGGLLGGVMGRFGSGVGGLRNSAARDITSILSPTTKENKKITQAIAPRLAQEGTTAMSREGLLTKYEANIGKIGDKLEAEYEKLPPDAKIDVAGLFETLNKKVEDLTVNGVVPSASQAKVNALRKVMADLANIGVEVGPDGTQVFADVGNVRKLRQIADKEIKKGFAFTDLDSANRAAQKQLANGIREQFSAQYPDIAKLNKDFNFWSSAAKVLGDAIERKTGQSGLLRTGISAGLGMGASPAHPVVGAMFMKTLSDFLTSPAYHTVTALIKTRIANAVEKADYAGAQKLIETALGTVPSQGAKGLVQITGGVSSE